MTDEFKVEGPVGWQGHTVGATAVAEAPETEEVVTVTTEPQPEAKPKSSFGPFQVNGKAYKDAVTLVAKAVGSQSPLPILRGIRHEVRDGKLYLTGTDLEMVAQFEMRADCKPGSQTSFVVNGKQLASCLKTVKQDDLLTIGLDDTGERLGIQFQSGAKVYLLLMALEDYPFTPLDPGQEPPDHPERTEIEQEWVEAQAKEQGIDTDNPLFKEQTDKLCEEAKAHVPQPIQFSMDGEKLAYLVQHIGGCAIGPRETSRLNLTALCWHVSERGSVEVVATNGYILGHGWIDTVPDLGVGHEYDVLLPAALLKKYAATFKKAGPCAVTLGRPFVIEVYMPSGTFRLSFRLIDEEYPDFERVIPKGNDVALTCKPKDLIEALELVGATTATESDAFVIGLDENGRCQLSSSSVEKGQTKLQLPVTTNWPQIIHWRREAAKRKVDETAEQAKMKGGSPPEPGKPLPGWFNASFRCSLWKQMAKAFEEYESLETRLSDAESAALVGGGDSPLIFVCMPSRMDL